MSTTLALVACLFTGPQGAQPPPEEPLRGPAVSERIARTLVRFNARGEFLRVEGRPEEAALAVLPLDALRRERAQEAVADRATALGVLLVDQIDLVREATDAIQAGDAERAQALSRDMYALYIPEGARDPVAAVLRDVLSREEHAELTRLVDEYWSAWIDWELRSARDRTDGARRRTEERLSYVLFQEELRLAYERTLRPYQERIEVIARAVEPTPEQRAEIRLIIIDYIRQGRLRPTPELRRDILRRIYLALDEERRTKFFDLVVTQIQ